MNRFEREGFVISWAALGKLHDQARYLNPNPNPNPDANPNPNPNPNANPNPNPNPDP